MKDPKVALPAKQDIVLDYIEYYGTKWSEGKLLICNDTAIKAKAKHFLEAGACPAEKFSRFSFYSIAENCLKLKKTQEGNVFRNLIKAFEFLELLCINLFLSPWRKEIKSLKTFTGNFVYCVQSVLPENIVETVLEKIGYTATTATEFSLVRKINEEEAKQTAFEIFLARIECETILEMTNEVQHSDLGAILQKRAQMHWYHEENKGRESQLFQREDPENLGNKENNETPSCLGAQQNTSTNSEKSFEIAGNSTIKGEYHFKPDAAPMLRLASTQSTSGLEVNQKQATESVYFHGKCSDSEDFLIKYSDIVIGQKPIFKEKSSLKELEKKLGGNQSEECILVTSAPLTANEASPSPLSPGASGPQAFAMFTDATPENRNVLDKYKAQEALEDTIEAQINEAMNCIDTPTNPADQPKELKPMLCSNTFVTEFNLIREDKVCELSSSFSKLKIQEASDKELMYPVEETVQPESIRYVKIGDKDIRECNHSKMNNTYPASAQATSKALFSVDQSSKLLGNASGSTECPTTGSDNKKPLMDTPGTHATSEGFRHIREPPNLTYIPPRSIDVQRPGSSITNVNCRKSNLQPEGGSLESSSSTDKGKFEMYTSKVNETNQEAYVIISKDD
uniref:Spermatogenesis-associated protein 2 PUB-like domain-containing protein n=1 Tax=Pelusios castaneus TaxID=367368 RepID=A0A8C8VEP9_9SAUR